MFCLQFEFITKHTSVSLIRNPCTYTYERYKDYRVPHESIEKVETTTYISFMLYRIFRRLIHFYFIIGVKATFRLILFEILNIPKLFSRGF
jgi:hypothetical protein